MIHKENVQIEHVSCIYCMLYYTVQYSQGHTRERERDRERESERGRERESERARERESERGREKSAGRCLGKEIDQSNREIEASAYRIQCLSKISRAACTSGQIRVCCGPNLYEEVSFTCLVNRLNIIQVLLVQSVDSCHIPGFNTLAPCVKIIKKPARNGYRGQYSSSMCRSIWVSFQVLSNGAVQSQDASQAPAWPLKMDCSPQTLQVSKPLVGTCAKHTDVKSEKCGRPCQPLSSSHNGHTVTTS